MKKIIVSSLTTIVLLFSFICFGGTVVDPTIKTSDLVAYKPPQVISVNVPDVFDENTNAVWDVIAAALPNLGPSVEIHFLVQGFGGVVYEGNKVIQAIKDAQKNGTRIVMDVIGETYSMHSYMTCYGDEVRMRPGSLLMFHSIARNMTIDFFPGLPSLSIKLNEDSSQQEIWLQQCVNKHILTPQMAQDVLNGREVYLEMTPKGLVAYSKTELDNVLNISFFVMSLCGLFLIIYVIKKL